MQLIWTGENAARLVAKVKEVVSASFQGHPMRHTTQAEINRRIEICVDYAQDMRKSKRWPLERCLDTMSRWLTKKLDTEKLEPSKRRMWRPDFDPEDLLPNIVNTEITP